MLPGTTGMVMSSVALTAAEQLWVDAKAAVSTVSPVSFWHNQLGVSTSGSQVTAVADQEGSNDWAQSTDARRPSLAADHILLTKASVEWMAVTISESANNWTFVWVVDLQSVTSFDKLWSGQTDAFTLTLSGPTAKISYYASGDWRNTGTAAATGLQSLVFLPKVTNAGEVRRTGVSLSTGMGYAATHALGGTVNMGSNYTDNLNSLDAKFYYAMLFSGVDATDTAALEAVIAANTPF